MADIVDVVKMRWLSGGGGVTVRRNWNYSDLPIRLVVLVLVRLTDVFRLLSVLNVETLTAPSGQPLLVNSSITSTQLLTRANVRHVLPSWSSAFTLALCCQIQRNIAIKTCSFSCCGWWFFFFNLNFFF